MGYVSFTHTQSFVGLILIIVIILNVGRYISRQRKSGSDELLHFYIEDEDNNCCSFVLSSFGGIQDDIQLLLLLLVVVLVYILSMLELGIGHQRNKQKQRKEGEDADGNGEPAYHRSVLT